MGEGRVQGRMRRSRVGGIRAECGHSPSVSPLPDPTWTQRRDPQTSGTSLGISVLYSLQTSRPGEVPGKDVTLVLCSSPPVLSSPHLSTPKERAGHRAPAGPPLPELGSPRPWSRAVRLGVATPGSYGDGGQSVRLCLLRLSLRWAAARTAGYQGPEPDRRGAARCSEVRTVGEAHDWPRPTPPLATP